MTEGIWGSSAGGLVNNQPLAEVGLPNARSEHGSSHEPRDAAPQGLLPGCFDDFRRRGQSARLLRREDFPPVHDHVQGARRSHPDLGLDTERLAQFVA
ncbi:MAG: hypothetical protein LAN37_04525 [Acidobacteriia bacterium]|nr:hypothetical protein [Terriglobia bacterium]